MLSGDNTHITLTENGFSQNPLAPGPSRTFLELAVFTLKLRVTLDHSFSGDGFAGSEALSVLPGEARLGQDAWRMTA